MYARRIGGRELTFDFATGLLKDNRLVVDRETGSLWSQLEGKAVSGPMEGTPLSVIPSLQTTWKHWKELYPDTLVMVERDSEGQPYVYRNNRPGWPLQNRKHDTSSLGLGLAMGGEAMYFSFRELERAGGWVQLTLGETPVVVHYRKKDALTTWAEDEDGNLLPGVLAYRPRWFDFHPGSKTYRAQKK